MAIALELCDRVNVYGMVAPDFCRWVGFCEVLSDSDYYPNCTKRLLIGI